MKYISVVILGVLLWWTWCLANGERSFGLAEHKRVEAAVEEDIRTFIQERYPKTTDLYCPQLFTEVVHPGIELIARFRCQVVGDEGDDTSEQVFEGNLRLISEDGFQSWSATGGAIQAKEIRFLKGVKITPEKSNERKK